MLVFERVMLVSSSKPGCGRAEMDTFVKTRIIKPDEEGRNPVGKDVKSGALAISIDVIAAERPGAKEVNLEKLSSDRVCKFMGQSVIEVMLSEFSSFNIINAVKRERLKAGEAVEGMLRISTSIKFDGARSAHANLVGSGEIVTSSEFIAEKRARALVSEMEDCFKTKLLSVVFETVCKVAIIEALDTC